MVSRCSLKIPTKDGDGKPNGWLLPIWNELEPFGWYPSQVYLTVVKSGTKKGPHLHKKREGRFICIRGNVEIRVRDERHDYTNYRSGDATGHSTIIVRPGCAAQLTAIGDEDAYVLNLPSPAWSSKDQDEWPVTAWRDE